MALESRSSLSCYLKVTNLCNLHCLHCYNVSSYTLIQPVRLSLNEVKVFVSALREFLLRFNFKEVQFIFHGGEPLLFGSDYVKAIINLIRVELSGTNLDVNFSIQSNLTVNVNEKFLKLLFEDFGGKVGTSFDYGIRFLEGSFKKFKETWTKNVKFLIESGIEVLVTVNLIKMFCYNFEFLKRLVSYVRSLNVQKIKFERFVPSGRGAVYSRFFFVDDGAFFRLMKKLLNFYVENLKTGDVFYLDPFRGMILNATRGTGYSCWSGTCLYNTLSIEPDGTVGICPEAMAHGSLRGKRVKSYADLESLIFDALKVDALLNLNESVEFLKCRFFSFCHRGCVSRSHDCRVARPFCEEFFSEILSVDNEIVSLLTSRK